MKPCPSRERLLPVCHCRPVADSAMALVTGCRSTVGLSPNSGTRPLSTASGRGEGSCATALCAALLTTWLSAIVVGSPVLRLDFGPNGSPVWPGFRAIGPGDAYSKGSGLGFVGKAKIHGADRGELLDELRRDLVWGRTEAAFRVDLPAGRYRLYMILGDYRRTCYSNDVMSLHVNGQPVLTDFLNWFVPQTHTVTVQDRFELALSGKWCLNALLVAPAEDEFVVLEKALRERTLSYYEEKPHVPKGSPHQASEAERERGFVVFQRDYMDPIWQNDPPRVGEPTQGLTVAASRGEGEPVSFGVHALKSLRRLTVRCELTAGIECRMLEVGYLTRRLGHWKVAKPPQGRRRYTRGWPSFLRPAGVVTLPAGRSQGYWLSVQAGEDVEPGTHEGKVHILSDGKPIVELPVTVTVWPFRLPSATDRAYETWYKDVWRHRVGGNDANYRDLVAHGINSLRIDTLPSVDSTSGLKMAFTALDADIAEARRYGLAKGILFGYQLNRLARELPGEVLSPENLKHLESAVRIMHEHAKEAKWPDPIMFHLVDEPAGRPKAVESAFKWYGAMTPILDRLEGKPRFETWCSTNFWKADDELKRFVPLVHVHSYNVRCISSDVVDVVHKSGREFSFYSNRKDPFSARMDAGLFLWRTGARRMSIVSYQYVAGDPFDDFTNATSDWTYTMTYPAPDGVYPNFAWECFREGTEDLRYVDALELALGSASADGEAACEARAFLDDLREGVSLNGRAQRSTGPFPIGTFDRLRGRCVELVTELSKPVRTRRDPWMEPMRPRRLAMDVRAGVWSHSDPIVTARVDLGERVDPDRLSVWLPDGSEPCAAEGSGEGVRFLIRGDMAPFDVRRVCLYFGGGQPAVASSLSSPVTNNLVPNSSFELASKRDATQPAGYGSEGPVRDGSVTLSKETPHSGDRCLCFEVEKPNAPTTYLSDKIPLKPNSEYVFSYWGRAPRIEGNGWGVFAQVFLYDADGNLLGRSQDFLGWHTAIRGREDNWRMLTERGYTLPGTVYGRVRLKPTAFVGTAYYDDISLVEASKWRPVPPRVVVGKVESRP